MYQPKTGEPCHCKKGIERDNCPDCEGTGWRIDFKAIRAKTTTKKFQITRTWDGNKDSIIPFVVVTLNSENECFKWILDNTPFSFHEATTNQGYRIREIG
jgi:hypothetical protein